MVRLLNHECKNIVKVTYNLIIQNIHNTIWLSLIKRFLGGNYFKKNNFSASYLCWEYRRECLKALKKTFLLLLYKKSVMYQYY